VLLSKALPGSFPVLTSIKIYCAATVSAAAIFYADIDLHAGSLILCISVLVALSLYIGLLGGLGELTRSELKILTESLKMSMSRREA
jgi:hypothetical protein